MRLFLLFFFVLSAVFFARAPQNTDDVVIYKNTVREPAPTIIKKVATSTPLKNKNIFPPPPPIAPPPLPAEALAKAGPQSQIRIPDATIFALGSEAVVNMLCQSKKENEYAVASGAIVDAGGYIISNAHIADTLNAEKTCDIRRGSPAEKFAKARLIFVPQHYNSTSTEADANVNARFDISIWKISDPPADLAYWELENEPIKPNQELLTMGYAAELLSSESIFKGLPLTFSSTIVESNNGIIIRARSSLSAQHGSSGGIFIDRYSSKIAGLIFGIGEEKNDQVSERRIFALTTKAIDTVMRAETGNTLAQYLANKP